MADPPDPGQPTLEAALKAGEPLDFSLKRAWRELIRALRAQKRAGGPAGIFASRREIERARASIPTDSTEDVQALKQALRAILRSPELSQERFVAAASADQLLGRLVPRLARGEVAVHIEGWPPGFGPEDRRRLLDPLIPGGLIELAADALPGPLPAAVAALVVHRIDGLVLGGSALQVRVQLPPDELLPPLDRAARDHSPRDGRGAWLPHLDAVGRFSLTPRRIAQIQAALLPRAPVIDACCGCGGNSVAFAAAGLRVHAIERDAARLELARRNAHDLGLSERITFHLADGATRAAELLEQAPGSSLFLDPPWGGPEGAEKPLSFDALLGCFAPLPVTASCAMIKLPRAFELSTLPGGADLWHLRYGFGEGDARGTVKLITAWIR